MRGRPTVQVLLRPARVAPGDTLEAEVILTSASVTPVEFVETSLIGTARALSGAHEAGAGFERRLLHLQTRATPGSLPVGPKRILSRFAIPADAPPAYAGARLMLSYILHIRVAIPWWPDRVADFHAPVMLGGPQLARPSVLSYVSRGSGAPGAELSVTFDDLLVRPGEVIEGVARVRGVSSQPVRGLTLYFVCRERYVTSIQAAKSYTVQILTRPPGEGEAIPFRVRLPADAAPSFTSEVAACEWSLVVRAGTASGRVVEVTAPLVVAPGPPPPATQREAALSSERAARRSMWRALAEVRGATYDEDRERLVGRAEGVDFAIQAETRGDVSALAAQLSFADLGLELHAHEHGLFDLFAKSMALALPAAAERFVVRGRDRAQIGALLSPSLLEALLSFREVHLDDTGGHLLGHESGKDRDELERFLDRVLEVARELGRNARALPWPEAMSTRHAAWRAFGERTSATPHAGKGALLGVRIAGATLDLCPRFDAKGKLEALDVRVPLDPPLDSKPDVGDPRLSPHARDLVREISSDPRGVFSLEADALLWHLGEVPEDPSDIEARLGALAGLAAALRGRGAEGPFR